MHDIWNPWHGCVKCSEGCQNCYMYYLDGMRDRSGAEIFKTRGGFTYPLQRKRDGSYKVQSGEMIRVCMTSDFFLDQADSWREDAWDIIRQRPDVKFFLLTKRPQRVAGCLPYDWGDGWENVFFNVTCENQRRAEERIPLLHSLPFRHKGIMCAPLIGPVDLDTFLNEGQIEQVICGGENYGGSRPCRYEWVQRLCEQCRRHDVTFNFIETGTVFVKDGKVYRIPDKRIQAQQAFRSGLQYKGRPIRFHLYDSWGQEIPEEQLYVPHYHPIACRECASRLTCNGCSGCGKCRK